MLYHSGDVHCPTNITTRSVPCELSWELWMVQIIWQVALCCWACIPSCMEGLQDLNTWGHAVQEDCMTLEVKVLWLLQTLWSTWPQHSVTSQETWFVSITIVWTWNWAWELFNVCVLSLCVVCVESTVSICEVCALIEHILLEEWWFVEWTSSLLCILNDRRV
jgi:hypothetical protein